MNRAKGCRGARTSKDAGGFATPVLRRPSHTKDFVNRADDRAFNAAATFVEDPGLREQCAEFEAVL